MAVTYQGCVTRKGWFRMEHNSLHKQNKLCMGMNGMGRSFDWKTNLKSNDFYIVAENVHE